MQYCLLFLLPLLWHTWASTGQYTLYRVVPETSKQLNFLIALYLNDEKFGVTFWKEPSGVKEQTHLMLSPRRKATLLRLIKRQGFRPTIMIENVQSAIEESKKRPTVDTTRLRDSVAGPYINLGQYHTYEEIVSYMNSLGFHYPQWAQTMVIGRTHEGRDISLIRIGAKKSTPGSKPAVWIDGGIHAREWIAPATALYFISRLVTGYMTDQTIRRLVDELDWYIVPVINPDGYSYSWRSSSPQVRLWRKNRSPTRCQEGPNMFGATSCCQGVDLNRNFDFHWGSTGASDDPCSEIYHGSAPFSEPESRAVRDFVMPRRSEFKAFITMHSYSQIWMYPFGHRRQAYPPDVNDLMSVAVKAKSALGSMYGTRYRVGTGADTLYPASGGSDDWAKSKAGIKYVYLLELRPEEQVWDGFLLREKDILPTAKETWEGIRVVADSILGPSNRNSGGVTEAPVSSDCFDNDSQCLVWAANGGCTFVDTRRRCRRSCGICTNPQAPCVDERTDCNNWKQIGMCNWVKSQCRRTCGLC